MPKTSKILSQVNEYFEMIKGTNVKGRYSQQELRDKVKKSCKNNYNYNNLV